MQETGGVCGLFGNERGIETENGGVEDVRTNEMIIRVTRIL